MERRRRSFVGVWVSLSLLLVMLAVGTEGFRGGRSRPRDRQESEDFEFADEAEAELQLQRKQILWEQDSSAESSTEANSENRETPDFCAMVRCPAGSACEVSEGAAVCVRPPPPTRTSTSESETSTDEPEELSRRSCTPCPVTKPSFVCGSDNRTYSSTCRLQYHNCVQKSQIATSCRGFCPCNNKGKSKTVIYPSPSTTTPPAVPREKLDQVKQRWHKFVAKYESSLAKANENKNNPDEEDYDNDVTATKSDSFGDEDNTKKKRPPAAPPIDEDKQRQQGHNSVLVEKVVTDKGNKKDCSMKELEVMGDRLLDWFSVVMADAKINKSRRRSHAPSPATFSSSCKPEVQWMFGHLDRNGDALLSFKELYDLEHEARERCAKPFLDRCDVNGDMLISAHEWCKCFDQSERPCSAARHRIRKAQLSAIGGYYPNCDEGGYFRGLQCHSSTGLCWCVDKYGVEYTNTRTRGRPDCDTLVGKVDSWRPPDDEDLSDGDDDDDDDDDGDDDDEGSADRPLDI